MSRRIYLVTLTASIVFLTIRAILQPENFDFDELAHVHTVTDIMRIGGLPGPAAFPEIAHAGPGGSYAYHYSPPSPYLAAAATATLTGRTPETTDILVFMRIIAIISATLTLLVVGKAIRWLVTDDRQWEACTFATAGLTLMPGFHSAAASASPETLMFLAIAGLTAALIYANQNRWSRPSTLAVGLAAAAIVGTRHVGYPSLLLIPMTLLGSRLGVRGTVSQAGIVAAIALGANSWWMIRSFLMFDDPIGVIAHVEATRASGHSLVARENQLWVKYSKSAFPEISLLSSTPWAWVQGSRMLLRITWIAPIALMGWIAIVVIPTTFQILQWTRIGKKHRPPHEFLLLGALAAPIVAFAIQASISARFGAFVSGRYEFANLLPLVIVTSGLLASRRLKNWHYVRSASLLFASVVTIVYLAVILP